MVKSVGKQFGIIFNKLNISNINMPLAFPLLGTYSIVIQIYVHIEMWTWMLIMALFV